VVLDMAFRQYVSELTSEIRFHLRAPMASNACMTLSLLDLPSKTMPPAKKLGWSA
jgi:hypothetical protein